MANPVYGKQFKASTDDGKRNGMFWVVNICMILFLVWAPFQIALFNGLSYTFERPIFIAVSLSGLLIILGLIYFYKQVKLDDQRDMISLLIILLPISYMISMFGAASWHYAVNMVLIQWMYAFIFIIGSYMLRDRLSNKMIQMTIMGSAYLIVMFGFINWFGQAPLGGKLVGWFSIAVQNGTYVDAIMQDSNGWRLTSVFQYANTYAAFLMAMLFAGLFNVSRLKKWYDHLLHGFMLVPIISSLILTLSRGGLVVLPFVLLILLLMLRPAQQILWVIYMIIAGAATAAILNPVTDIGLQVIAKYDGAVAAKGWAYLLVASLIVGLLALVIGRFVAPKLESMTEGWGARRFASVWLPIGSAVLGGIILLLLIATNLRNLLPENIRVRFENINFQQSSVLERFTFYRDALKLFREYPIFGGGGGAWGASFEAYQNNPYVSRQVHNFFFQYLVEVGAVGFIIFILFIGFIFFAYIRSYIKSEQKVREGHFLYFIITVSILLHSLLDFNLSYAYMSILVYLGLGGMTAAMIAKPLKRLRLKEGLIRGLYTVVIGMTAIIISFTSLRFAQAASDVAQVTNLSRNPQATYEQYRTLLDDALSIRSTYPEAVVYLSSLLIQGYQQTKNDQFYNEDLALLTKAHEREPYNKEIVKQMINLYQVHGESDKAFALTVDSLPKYKWDISWYENVITQAYTLGSQAYERKDYTTEQKDFQIGLNTYQQVLDGIQYLTTLPKGQLQGREFDITPQLALNVGQIYLMEGNNAQAVTVLKRGLKDDLSDATNKQVAIYYLAALKKEGQNDQTVYANVIKADPKAKDQIDAIASQTYTTGK
ncbi:Wzy polymerase domain-containing protein [Paenibacillus campi]|uniref:Wzy polymerase domain-containing protein n=1 Tax=Paenibacillus campi TaxID=3106031 RepID=UPI002AFF0591|nr:O-antigen ligase family protein [Paenibacillus sp. SGZ-1014]